MLIKLYKFCNSSFLKNRSFKNIEAKIGKKSENWDLEVQTQKIKTQKIKNFLAKEQPDLYIVYTNLVDAIIRHQRLCLTCMHDI